MRYQPLTAADRLAMLERVGVSAVDALYADVPAGKTAPPGAYGLSHGAGEMAVERHMAKLAARSRPAGAGPFYCGAGAYRHHVPATVDHLIQRSEFLTSYTPYQPEISQGTLQCLFEFQTQVALLTGMEIANASMYDGSTATAEAVLMAMRLTKRKKAVLAGTLHPHYAATVRTIAGLHGDIVGLDPLTDGPAEIDGDTACVVVQTPDVLGTLHDLAPLAETAHTKGALLIAVVTECVSLGLVTPPGEMGADIVCAEGQSLGNGLNFGGPYVGLMACREKFVRQMPGRLCGQTVDTDGRRGFVLTLSTREQHIRREKATSNICTNSGLCALAFTIHLTLLGESGFRKLATLNHARACALADTLNAIDGVALVNRTFFNEFTLRLNRPAAPLVETLVARGILAGVPAARLYPHDVRMENLLIVAATEMTTTDDDAAFAAALAEVLK